jgi:hypothetical protein
VHKSGVEVPQAAIWFWTLITVFRRQDFSGWGKVGWTVFGIVLRFLGVLVYLGTRGRHMPERRVRDAQAGSSMSLPVPLLEAFEHG